MAFSEGQPRQEVYSGKAEHYSGKEHEFSLFGVVDIKDPAYLADLKAARGQERTIPFDAALALTKKHQPWSDPANPDTDFFREVLIAVQDKLGLDAKKANMLRAYTAVGTPLDILYGTDAFISYSGKGGEEIITIDATLRREKLEQGHKADIIVGELPDAQDDEDGYLAAIDTIADRIAKRFKPSENVRRAA
ncbi:MAG: hypothetical protein RLZZ324_443 [Candidatus Parcubacteria bacterium]|jgi:hypothetical protein